MALDLSRNATLATSDVPSNAILAGVEHGKPTFIARVQHDGHWEVAKLNAWAKFGFGFHGRELEKDAGEVLVACEGQVIFALHILASPETGFHRNSQLGQKLETQRWLVVWCSQLRLVPI